MHALNCRSMSALGRYDDRLLVPAFGVCVRSSGIGGHGVFASRGFSPGEAIVVAPVGCYRTEAQAEGHAGYCFPVPDYRGVVVDLWDVAYTNFARYFNSAEGLVGVRPNVRIDWRGGAVAVFVAGTPIAAGEEMLLDYPL